MTISIAWIRSTREGEELLFVSDSRLGGDGTKFDCTPKLVQLPRTDCAIGFAGYSGHGYPMMQQLSLAIEAHGPLKDRALKLPILRTHALKIFDSMAEKIEPEVDGLGNPEAEFILGGYNWSKKCFQFWRVYYVPGKKCYEAHPPFFSTIREELGILSCIRSKRNARSRQNLGEILFAGDQAGAAKRRLSELVKTRLEENPGLKSSMKWDLEPFEVVRDMLRDPGRSDTIGGPPQLIRVFQYMKSAPVGVFWPEKMDGNATILGRPVLSYENVDFWILDPDSLEFTNMFYGQDREEIQIGSEMDEADV